MKSDCSTSSHFLRGSSSATFFNVYQRGALPLLRANYNIMSYSAVDDEIDYSESDRFTPESEPLDPSSVSTLDYSGTIHEIRERTPLASPDHDALPGIYTSDDGVYIKEWKQARRAYRRHRNGEFFSDFSNTLFRRSRADYYRFLETDRQLQEKYTELSTALLSLRVPPTSDSEYLSPLVTLDALHDALGDVMAALCYRLRGYDYEYARVTAGTDEFATPHIHIYVWIDGRPSFEELEPVVEKFVEKCELAPSDGRGNRASEGALTFSHRPEVTDSGETAGIKYIATQLPHIAYVEEMDDGSLDWGTVAHATSRQIVACSYLSRSDLGVVPE